MSVIVLFLAKVYRLAQTPASKNCAKRVLRRRKFALLLFFIGLSTNANDYGNATVSEVRTIYDGDRFRANIKGWPDIIGKSVPIRILGIDTPEMRGKCQEEKILARQAKQHTVALLRSGKVIQLTSA